MNCPNCQTPNSENHNFCKNCGKLLLPTCPRCDFNLTQDVNFCGRCGLGLTPQSQFVWGQGRESPTHHQAISPELPDIHEGPLTPAGRLAGEPAPKPLPSQPHPESLPGASSRPALPSEPHLDQYIPRELVSKLDAARARGEMVGERRVVTMLFCDVKGSTAAAEQLDPEDWTEIINGAFEFMIKPVYKYEGTVARLMGDAILAFFGAPLAHEDDPQRAILAGLDIVSSIAPYRERIKKQWGLDFNVRVGINTGLVVVGAVGSDLRMEYTAMGDAINLAARMEQTAVPGTVQIAQDTFKLVKPLFEFEDLGGIEVKGKDAPVPAYRVLGRKTAPGRLRGIEGLEAGLVGRADEMARMNSVLSDLKHGVGRFIFLIGGAGLGKSRLIRELKGNGFDGQASKNGENASSTLQQITWVETASLSYESTFPYALFQRLIRRLNGISASDEASQFWEKLHAMTSQIPENEARYTRVFATLFGLSDPAGQPHLEGENFKRELYTAMAEIWKSHFKTQPTILVLDDLHWADPASIDMLLHLLPTLERSPVVLLCAFRKDRDASSFRLKQTADSDYHHRYTEINLHPLSDEQSDELVNRLLSIADLPDSLRGRIQERAAGNPFFVEEVVRTLIEKGAVVAEDRSENGAIRRYWRATSESAAIDIPDSLQGLLASRIDRLEENTRQIIQLAAVIGRSFHHRVLTEIGKDDARSVQSVEDQIIQLVRLEMIQEAARVPEVEYKFRNPLTQEIAYQTILLKRRREFHQRVGAALETLFPNQLSELAPRLAFHFSEGQHAEKALAYFILVADSAFRLFALEGALANYDQAIAWAERGGASPQQLIHLYRRQGRVLELLLRHDEALETYKALERLGEAREDENLRLAGIVAQGTAYIVGQMDVENSRVRSEEALLLARKLGDRATEARCLWNLLLAFSWFDPQKALEYGEKGLAISRDVVARGEAQTEDREQLALILLDLSFALISDGQINLALEYIVEAQQIFEEFSNLPMVSTASQRLGFAYKADGRFDQSLDAYERSIDIDESIGNDGGLIGSFLGLSDLYPALGDFTSFLDALKKIKPIAEREGKIPMVLAELFPVIAYYHLGALEQIRRVHDLNLQFFESGFPIWPAILLSNVVLAYIESGELEIGKELLDKIGDRFDEENFLVAGAPNVIQARAELALADGDLPRALTQVETFLEKASQKGMLALLPHKLLLLGKIHYRADRFDEARAALQEAHQLATEQKARPVLWKICAQLARLEAEIGNVAEAQALKDQARAAIEFIADHAGGEELRESFLSTPQVQKILSDTGERED